MCLTQISDFGFEMKNIIGNENHVADALRRILQENQVATISFTKTSFKIMIKDAL